MNHEEIRRSQHQLSDERHKMQRELIQDYDKTVYLPARRANMQACEKLGHELGPFYSNVLGRGGQICQWCDETIFEEEEDECRL